MSLEELESSERELKAILNELQTELTYRIPSKYGGLSPRPLEVMKYVLVYEHLLFVF